MKSERVCQIATIWKGIIEVYNFKASGLDSYGIGNWSKNRPTVILRTGFEKGKYHDTCILYALGSVCV